MDNGRINTMFLAGLQEILGKTDTTIALHEPQFSGSEWELVKDCLDSGWVSSVGKYVDEFEARLASFTGAKHAIAVVNGTSALHVALILAGVQADDEVLIPALSFVATANAVAYCGAVPHFLDSNINNLGIDIDALAAHLKNNTEMSQGQLRNSKTGRRIAAIVPMHVFGHPVDMSGLMEIAGRYHIPVVEDAAESLGSYYYGQHTGTLGKLGILSFNGNKIITTGGGGAILTNDSELARKAKHLTTTAKQPHRWEFYHDVTGFNYRLPNLNAALGCAQMERLPELLTAKRLLAEKYRSYFDVHSDVLQFIAEPKHCQSNYWLNAVHVKQADKAIRDLLLEEATNAGYQCRPVWQLLHKLPMYAAAPRAELPVAECLEQQLINLPSSAKLGLI